MASSTYAGLAARSELRPFVLTRSFFAGIQRYAAVWTGDSEGTWDHLRLSFGMLQNLCTVGINFCGSDVPGFLSDVSDDLLYRWYQASVYFPFMRGHADLKTKRREPWLLSSTLRIKIQKTIMQRYEILPYLYTAFYLSYVRTWPIVMPLWMKYKEKEVFDIEDEFMFGPSLLVRPVHSDSGVVKVYLPVNEVWYQISTGEIKISGETIYSTAELENIPVYIRGGSIVPLYVLPKITSTMQLVGAPVALLIALKNYEARGFLYVDDGETFKYQAGEYSIFKYEYKKNKLTTTIIKTDYRVAGYYKRITILGMLRAPNKAEAVGKEKVVEHIEYDGRLNRAIIHLYSNAISLMEKLEITFE
jgi:alpha-glucosidase (family GH31 glycosyl hydrolase)